MKYERTYKASCQAPRCNHTATGATQAEVLEEAEAHANDHDGGVTYRVQRADHIVPTGGE